MGVRLSASHGGCGQTKEQFRSLPGRYVGTMTFPKSSKHVPEVPCRFFKHKHIPHTVPMKRLVVGRESILSFPFGLFAVLLFLFFSFFFWFHVCLSAIKAQIQFSKVQTHQATILDYYPRLFGNQNVPACPRFPLSATTWSAVKIPALRFCVSHVQSHPLHRVPCLFFGKEHAAGY